MNAVRKILLVDDDTALRQSLAEQLQHDGEFAVVECDTGIAARTAVEQERFDAMLLDVGLPDMDGRDLCREFRRAARHRARRRGRRACGSPPPRAAARP